MSRLIYRTLGKNFPSLTKSLSNGWVEEYQGVDSIFCIASVITKRFRRLRSIVPKDRHPSLIKLMNRLLTCRTGLRSKLQIKKPLPVQASKILRKPVYQELLLLLSFYRTKKYRTSIIRIQLLRQLHGHLTLPLRSRNIMSRTYRLSPKALRKGLNLNVHIAIPSVVYAVNTKFADGSIIFFKTCSPVSLLCGKSASKHHKLMRLRHVYFTRLSETKHHV